MIFNILLFLSVIGIRPMLSTKMFLNEMFTHSKVGVDGKCNSCHLCHLFQYDGMIDSFFCVFEDERIIRSRIDLF